MDKITLRKRRREEGRGGQGAGKEEKEAGVRVLENHWEPREVQYKEPAHSPRPPSVLRQTPSRSFCRVTPTQASRSAGVSGVWVSADCSRCILSGPSLIIPARCPAPLSVDPLLLRKLMDASITETLFLAVS